MGRKFTVISDQKALKFLIEQPQFQKWFTKLLGYDFEILYQLGLQNKAADVPKINHQAELAIMMTSGLVDVEVVLREVEQVEVLSKIIGIKKIKKEERISSGRMTNYGLKADWCYPETLPSYLLCCTRDMIQCWGDIWDS